jgi:predicted nucleic acid-binding protein
MVTAVDTNILFDVGFGARLGLEEASRALEIAGSQGPLVVSEISYGEASRNYATALELDEFLDSLSISVLPLDKQTAFLAGQFFREYKLRGGTRERILPDFLIAAHAQLYADRILTRDHRFFTGNFPKLTAVAPEDL